MEVESKKKKKFEKNERGFQNSCCWKGDVKSLVRLTLIILVDLPRKRNQGSAQDLLKTKQKKKNRNSKKFFWRYCVETRISFFTPDLTVRHRRTFPTARPRISSRSTARAPVSAGNTRLYSCGWCSTTASSVRLNWTGQWRPSRVRAFFGKGNENANILLRVRENGKLNDITVIWSNWYRFRWRRAIKVVKKSAVPLTTNTAANCPMPPYDNSNNNNGARKRIKKTMHNFAV